MSRLLLGILPIGLLVSGCSVALDAGEVQCETASDCEARGFENATCVSQVCQKKPEPPPPDKIWGCLGDVVEPTPDITKKVELSVQLAFIGGGPVTGVNIDVCDKLDPDCLGMSTALPKGLSPDSNGLVTFEVPQGFDGFVRVADTSSSSGDPSIMPSRIYVGRPIVTPPKVKEVQLLSPFDYTTLIAYAKLQHDMTRGTTIILAVDCKGDNASGVRFTTTSADAESQEYYLVNQNPAAPPDATQTDVDGFGGFFNLEPGLVIAKSIRAKDDAYIGESSFQVLPETISYVQIAPTPK